MVLRTDARYWSDRYKEGYTGWDIGSVSTPIAEYIDQLSLSKNAQILIPGAGYGHEAVYLHTAGYRNITVVDIAVEPINYLKAKGLDVRLEQCDFFDHRGKYDLILEQTFFCAIDPGLRSAYIDHARELVNDGGRLAGVLFDTVFDHPGPPHGGSIDEYQRMFSRHFANVTIAPCYNSIPPRKGKECFIVART